MKRGKHIVETVVHALFLLFGLVAVGCVLVITVYLVISGIPAIRKIGLVPFLFGKTWASTAAEPQYGILPFILTSVYGTAGAIVLGVPVGFLTAVYLAKLAPKRVKDVMQTAVSLLAGIPSVVYGLVGMLVLVPGIRKAFHLPDGASLLAAIIVLAVMILPSIIKVSATALEAVPREYEDASLALGATPIETYFKVSVPAAKSGIAAAVVLVVLGGGLMPSFSTVGNGSSGASADAGDAVAAVTADSYSDDAGAASDGAAADIAEAAENAGVNSASRSVPETAVQGTSDIAAGGSASGETAPQTAAEEDTPSVFSLPEADSSTAAQSGGISGRAISDGDSAGIVPDEDTGALTLPEAVRGLRIAHCYIADGGELPELDGKLLYSDSSAAWFQLDNNMSTLQNTLNALEKSGCTVTAYEDIGLTLDSRADSWLLIVRN